MAWRLVNVAFAAESYRNAAQSRMSVVGEFLPVAVFSGEWPDWRELAGSPYHVPHFTRASVNAGTSAKSHAMNWDGSQHASENRSQCQALRRTKSLSLNHCETNSSEQRAGTRLATIKAFAR